MSSSFDRWENLPEEVAMIILNFLSFEDLFLNGSLVCKNWHNFIGNQKNCMDKIKLKIEGWQDLETISKVLSEESPRNYSSLEFYNVNPEKVIKFEYLLLREWKDVTLTQMQFLSSHHFYSLLKNFGASIEKLTVERIFIMSEEKCEYSLWLPNLKKLRLKQVQSSAFQIFRSYSNIKLLEFDIPAFGSKRRIDIADFMEEFRNVQLQELIIYRNSLYGLPIETHRIIESVIISMTDSLKKLKLSQWGYSHTIEAIWNSMKVSYFSIDVCSSVPLTKNIINLSPNVYLRTLNLTFYFLPNVDWFKCLFSKTAMLPTLYISVIRKEIVYYAATYLLRLKNFRYKSCMIEVIKAADDDNEDEEEMSDPGRDFDYIGPNEILYFTGSQAGETTNIKTFNDEKLTVDFAAAFYNELKARDSSINQKINLTKIAID